MEALPLPQLPPSPPHDTGRTKKARAEEDAAAQQRGVTVDVGRPVSALFNTKQLAEFTRATGLAGMVSLSLSRSMPCRIRYDIPAASSVVDEHGDGGGFVCIYLAPRMHGGEEEEEDLADLEAQEAAAAGLVAAPAGAEPEDG